MSEIRDKNLAASGEQKILWASSHMPVLSSIHEDFKREKPFDGLRVALSVHMEAKTAYLATVMKDGGAERKLRFLGVSFDHLTKEQQEYIDSWNF